MIWIYCEGKTACIQFKTSTHTTYMKMLPASAGLGTSWAEAMVQEALAQGSRRRV